MFMFHCVFRGLITTYSRLSVYPREMYKICANLHRFNIFHIPAVIWVKTGHHICINSKSVLTVLIYRRGSVHAPVNGGPVFPGTILGYFGLKTLFG